MACKVKIGISGTHSTGKSTFLRNVESFLHQRGHSAHYFPSLAVAAHGRGFPILRNHTYESTLWIVATGMQQEAEASLNASVLLIDRPVIDALAYLMAALELSGREIPARKLHSLHDIVAAHSRTYDILIVTKLDPDIPLAEGRDQDPVYRLAVAQHLSRLSRDLTPHAQIASYEAFADLVRQTCDTAEVLLSSSPPR